MNALGNSYRVSISCSACGTHHDNETY